MSLPFIAFGLPSGSEWFIIVLVILLFFGAKKLPELARGIGRSLGEFKKGKEEFETELKKSIEESSTTSTPVPKSAPCTVASQPVNSAPAPAASEVKPK